MAGLRRQQQAADRTRTRRKTPGSSRKMMMNNGRTARINDSQRVDEYCMRDALHLL